MATLSELEKIQRNLYQAIRMLQAVQKDLATLQAKQSNPIDLEAHLDNIDQAERLWGDEHRRRVAR